MMLDQCRIVLVETSHPGNIGSVARAMKTMGLSQLYLVSPKQFPHDKAYEMASGAADILDNAVVCSTFHDAVKSCQLVIGTSARMRSIPWPLLTPKELVTTIQVSHAQSVAIVFGCEQSGLPNSILEMCHYHVHIPANPEYSSLNLGAAVQVIAYELYQGFRNALPEMSDSDPLASVEAMERYFEHLEKVLTEIDFLKASAPRQLMRRLRRFYLRAKPDESEMNILRGILTAIQNRVY